MHTHCAFTRHSPTVAFCDSLETRRIISAISALHEVSLYQNPIIILFDFFICLLMGVFCCIMPPVCLFIHFILYVLWIVVCLIDSLKYPEAAKEQAANSFLLK